MITKLKKKRQAKLRYRTTKKLIENVSKKLKIGLQLLREDNRKAKVIVSPTIRLDLRENNGISVAKKTQRKLKRMVTAMNKMLKYSNEQGSKVP